MDALQQFISNTKAAMGSTDDDMTFILKHAYPYSASNQVSESSISLMKILENIKVKTDGVVASYFNGKLESFLFNQFLNSSSMGYEVFSPSFSGGTPIYDGSPLAVLKQKLDSIDAGSEVISKFSQLLNVFRLDVNLPTSQNKMGFDHLPIRFPRIPNSPLNLSLNGSFVIKMITKYIIPHEYSFSINMIDTYDKNMLAFYERNSISRGVEFDVDLYRSSGQYVRGIVNGLMYLGNGTTKEIPWANNISYSFYGMDQIMKDQIKITKYAEIIEKTRNSPMTMEEALKITYELKDSDASFKHDLAAVLAKAMIALGLNYEENKDSINTYIEKAIQWAVANISFVQMTARAVSGLPRDAALVIIQAENKLGINSLGINVLDQLASQAINYFNSEDARTVAQSWARELKERKANIVQSVDDIMQAALDREAQELVDQSYIKEPVKMELSDLEKQALSDQKEEDKKSNKLAITAGLIAAMAIIASAG